MKSANAAASPGSQARMVAGSERIFYINFVCRIRKNSNFPRSSSILLSSYGSSYNPLNKGVLKVSPNHLPHEKRMPEGTLLHDLSATP
jgi:hypothetical protein